MKYKLRRNRCDCHPETCNCHYYAIYKDNKKFITIFDENDGIEIVDALNFKDAYDQKKNNEKRKK